MGLRHELQVARMLAAQAADLASQIRAEGIDKLGREEKEKGEGPVTRADKEVDCFLRESLLRYFPQDSVLSEEADEDPSRLTSDRCWCVDPIDGTRDFADGGDSWAIHIGLAINGRATLGVVAQPSARRVSWGIVAFAGEPAVAESQLSGHEPTRLLAQPRTSLRMLSSRSHAGPRINEVSGLLGVSDQDHLRASSVGVKASRLLLGDAELYVHPTAGTKLWDSCAPAAILYAAGGGMTDCFGNELLYAEKEIRHRQGLIATAGIDHQQIVEKLSPLAKAWFAGS